MSRHRTQTPDAYIGLGVIWRTVFIDWNKSSSRRLAIVDGQIVG